MRKFVEKHINSYRTQSSDGTFIHDNYIVKKEEQDFIIVEKYLGDELKGYVAYYKINDEVFYTISAISAMKEGSSIFTTKKLEFALEKNWCIVMEVFFDELIKGVQEEITAYIQMFKEFLSKHPLVRIPELTGEYHWYFQDGRGRVWFNEK